MIDGFVSAPVLLFSDSANRTRQIISKHDDKLQKTISITDGGIGLGIITRTIPLRTNADDGRLFGVTITTRGHNTGFFVCRTLVVFSTAVFIIFFTLSTHAPHSSFAARLPYKSQKAYFQFSVQPGTSRRVSAGICSAALFTIDLLSYGLRVEKEMRERDG